MIFRFLKILLKNNGWLSLKGEDLVNIFTKAFLVQDSL